jgi:hypothetical protein
MIEVRSYRRVFDLERRIYTVDRLRLNPGGVPVRGVLYFLWLLVATLLLTAMPLVGSLAREVPWYLRDLLGPGCVATVLSIVRVDGRTFHLSARSLLGFCLQPRELDGLRSSSSFGTRWAPGEIAMLPDGSDSCFRSLRYRGPGAVLVMIEHRLDAVSASPWRLFRAGGRSVRLSALEESPAPSDGRVVSLARDATLSVMGGTRR